MIRAKRDLTTGNTEHKEKKRERGELLIETSSTRIYRFIKIHIRYPDYKFVIFAFLIGYE